MAFVGAAPGWFRSKTAAGQGQGRPPLPKPPLGKRDPPLRYQVGFTGSLCCCPRNGSPPCHPEDRAFSRGPPLAASPLGPQRQSARGSPGDLGPGPGASQGSGPGGAGLGGRDPRPRTGSAVASQACAQLRPLRVLLWLKLPHTAPTRQTWTRGFHSPKSVLPTGQGTVTLQPGSPRAPTPLSVKAAAASCPWCPQKAFTCGEPEPGCVAPGT